MGWHPIVWSCDDNLKEDTTNQKKLYSQDHPRVDNDDEYGRITDFDMSSHVSGMSVREVLQEPSGLQIHQTKSGSQICEKHQQRKDLPGETGEITIQSSG